MFRLETGIASAVFLLAVLGASYPDGPPFGHTGGFGEPTCYACHFDEAFNSSDAQTQIRGVPETYVADSVYTITVFLTRPSLGAGGFSMSSRFLDGSQAGRLQPSEDGRTKVVDRNSIEYLMQTLEGSEPLARDSTSWTIGWRAPVNADSVVFHLAANAANGDDSEFGDVIRIDSAFTRTVGPN